MVSRRALVLAAVLVTVLALAAGAASVQDLDQVEQTPGEGDGGEGIGSPTDTIPPFISIPGWVLLVLFVAALVIAAIGLLLMPDERRRFFRRVALVVLIGIIFLFVADVVDLAFPELEFDSESPNATEAEEPGGEGESAEEGDGGDTTNPTTPFVALFVLLGVGLLGLLLFFRSSSDEEEEEELDDITAREAVGRAAGRAADRIDEDDPLENAVYQAWHEMTTALDIPNPSTRTPAEFKRAAIEAGLAAEDVETLTDLFREVRYGDATVTPERERQARETLRRIEAAYAEDTADEGGGNLPHSGDDTAGDERTGNHSHQDDTAAEADPDISHQDDTAAEADHQDDTSNTGGDRQ